MALHFRDLASTFLDLWIPPRCWGCRRRWTRDLFCPACRPVLAEHRLPPRGCARCGMPMEGRRCYRCRTFGRPFAFDRAWGSFYYAGWIRRLLHAGKYRPAPAIFPALAELCRLDWPMGMDRVVPVPGHPHHRKSRGFVPTHVLAQTVADFARLPMTPGLRVNPSGPPQQSLRQEERLRQAQADRFRWSGPPLKGETVLLVDDVMTTGATAHAAARTLKDAGAARVWVWTVAQEVPHAWIPVVLNRLEPLREVQV